MRDSTLDDSDVQFLQEKGMSHFWVLNKNEVMFTAIQFLSVLP